MAVSSGIGMPTLAAPATLCRPAHVDKGLPTYGIGLGIGMPINGTGGKK
jgi:hypothetical protein